MKIWDLNKIEEIEQPKEMKEFIDEIIKVMKKHNLSISHEDSHGAFIIEKYEEYNINGAFIIEKYEEYNIKWL